MSSGSSSPPQAAQGAVAAAPTPALSSSPATTAAFDAAASSSSSSSQLRPNLIASAVSFLADPKVQSSTLSQRVSFLESKGLSPIEIDEALRQVGGGSSSQAIQPYASAPVPAPAYYAGPALPPRPLYAAGPVGPYGPPGAAQRQGLDWRDWFIMTVVGGSVGYGIISLAKRYLFPHLQPPNATALEADLTRLNAKYDEVAATLASIDEETQAIRTGVDEQRADVERSVDALDAALATLQEGERRRDEDMRTVKREVDKMKDELPALFAKSKDAQAASLREVQAELKSLKALLVSSRGAAAAGSAAGQAPSSPALGSSSSPSSSTTLKARSGEGASSTSTAPSSAGGGAASLAAGAARPSSPSTFSGPPPFLSSRPAIPAWQLAGGSGAATTATASSSSSTTSAPAPSSTATSTSTAPASGSGSGSGSSSHSTVTSADADTLTKSSTSESSD